MRGKMTEIMDVQSGKFESTEDHYVIYTPQVLTAVRKTNTS